MSTQSNSTSSSTTGNNATVSANDIFGDNDPEIQQMEQQIDSLDTDQLKARTRMLDNNIRVMKSELQRLQHEKAAVTNKIKENNEKIKMNKQLPYLVSNVIEILDLPPEVEDEGAAVNETAQRNEKCVVIKTSTRQTVFLPVVGLVEPATLKPSDLVGVNKDSYLILDTLPRYVEHTILS